MFSLVRWHISHMYFTNSNLYLRGYKGTYTHFKKVRYRKTFINGFFFIIFLEVRNFAPDSTRGFFLNSLPLKKNWVCNYCVLTSLLNGLNSTPGRNSGASYV